MAQGEIARQIAINVKDGFSKHLERLKRQLKKIVKAASKIGKAGAGLRPVFDKVFNTAAQAATKLTRGLIGGVLGALKTIGKAAVGLTATVAGLSFGFYKLSESIGAIQNKRVVFEGFVEAARRGNQAFAEMAPNIDVFVNKLRVASRGMMSYTDMAEAANHAFALMGAEVGTKLPRVFEVATAAANIMGKDVEKMVSSLVMGAGRLYTRYFAQLGLMVDLNYAQEKYAEQLGITTQEMSRQQKSVALLNEALRQGEALVAAMGDTEALLAFQTGAVKASFVDLKDNILMALGPALTVAMGYVREFVTKTIPLASVFAESFMNVFYKVSDELPHSMSQGVLGAESAVANGAQRMGTRAGEWAVNAASWGANIGSSLAVGILEGFTYAIVTVMNTISAILENWLAPGSPPRVAPDIINWGMDAIAEWYGAMEEYDPQFSGVLQKLKKQFEAKPKKQLMEWGVSAIASWAKGLSIFDLELLEKQVEMKLEDARKALERMEGKLKGEETALFEMQVLGKDEDAIRGQLQQVQATRAAVKEQERQVNVLENRKSAIQEQLELFRMLNRMIDEVDEGIGSTADKMKKAAKAAGGAAKKLGEITRGFDFPAGGPSVIKGLKKKMGGFAQTVREILQEPFNRVRESFNTNVAMMMDAWNDLSETLNKSNIPDFFSEYNTVLLVGAGATALFGAKAGLALAMMTLLGKTVDDQSRNKWPHLHAALSPVQRGLLVMGRIAEWARDVIIDLRGAVHGLVAIPVIKMAQGFQSVADWLGKIGGQGSGLEEFARSFEKSNDLVIDTMLETRREYNKWADDFELNVNEMAEVANENIRKQNEMGAAAQRYALQADRYLGEASDVASKHFEDIGASTSNVTQGTDEALSGWSATLNRWLTETDDFGVGMEAQMSGMSTRISEEIVPQMASSIESELGGTYASTGEATAQWGTETTQQFNQTYDTIKGDTASWSSGTQQQFEALSQELLGDSGIVPVMFDDFEEIAEERLGDLLNLFREFAAETCAALNGVKDTLAKILKKVKELKKWADENKVTIRIQVQQSGSIPENLEMHSPPPLATAVSMVNDELREMGQLMRSVGTSRPIGAPVASSTPAPADASSTVQFNESLVGTLVVPNMQVGRQFAKDLSVEIGNMINARRQPA